MIVIAWIFLHQISAIQSAMDKVSLALLDCVANAIKGQDGESAIKELMAVMKTITK